MDGPPCGPTAAQEPPGLRRPWMAPGGPRALQEPPAPVEASALLELFRRELVARQELVEIGPVALGEPRRLAHIAAGDLQNLRQVAAGELVTGLIERGQSAGAAAQGLLHELHRNDRSL